MKLTIILIIVLCGVIGFFVKSKYTNQVKILRELKNYFEFLLVNISIYKNDLSKINNNYLIVQNNKNAKFDNFFRKNNNFCDFNTKNIDEQILREDWRVQIHALILGLGKSDRELECEKLKKMIDYLSEWIVEAERQVKEKGDLYFKIWLAIGVVVGIVLW